MRRRLLTTIALGAVILAALFFTCVPPTVAHGTYTSTAEFVNAEILAPHQSAMSGSDIANAWRWYGIDVLDFLVITGAETSVGDPRLGGRLVAASNFGCLRNHGPDTKWGRLSDGVTWIRGKDWYTFPSPAVGVMALGRYLKAGTTKHPGVYLPLLETNDWRAFAAIYYGRDVAGFESYVARLYAIEARFRALAHAHGFWAW